MSFTITLSCAVMWLVEYIIEMGIHNATQLQWHSEISTNIDDQTTAIVYHERDLFISYV